TKSDGIWYFLHDVRVTQVQLDELFALLRAVKDGEVSEAEALTRLSRSPHWVVGSDRSGHQTAADYRYRGPHPRDGPTGRPSGGAGVGPGLCPFVSHRWIQGVSHRLAHPLRPVGPPPALPGHGPRPKAALDAT